MSSYTTGSQSTSAVQTFTTPSSPFVIAWTGEGVGDTSGVFFRRFSSAGMPLGSDLPADTTGGISAIEPDIAAFGTDLASGFVVVWTAQAGGVEDVMARRFGGADSAPVGAAFRVNLATTGYQFSPKVATAPNGDFVIVWSEEAYPDAPSTIHGRRFSMSAAPLGDEFRLDSYTTGAAGADVVGDGTGGFIVVWSQFDGAGEGVFVRRVSAAGSLVGAPLRLNAATTGNQESVVIASGGGSFLVVWGDLRSGPENVEVVARRLDPLGNPLGAEFRLNTYTSNAQESQVVAGDAAGNFLVVWRSSGQDGSAQSVHGRLVVGGSPRGGEFRVNAYTTNAQAYPSVGTVAPGRFVVAWQSQNQDGSASGVFARAACVHGDTNGDGLVDVSDVFYLINALFAGGPAPIGCSDVNGDDATDVADVFYLINFLFAGGPPPA